MKKDEKTPVFAKRIHELRTEKKWSQPKLAKMIGTPGPFILKTAVRSEK